MNRNNRLPPAVWALIGLSFALGSCEYVVVAILPDIAGGLGASLAAAGKLVSVFAAGYAIGTPILMAAAGRVPKYRLLMALLALFLGANAMSMLAPNLTVLYLSRALAAVLTGTLTAVIFLFVREVTPHELSARAVSLVYAGMSLATVVGNPLNKLICRYLSWRAAFARILAVGAVLLPVLARLLPHRITEAPEESGSFFRQFAVLRDPRYSLCVLMTVCCYGATYVVYTYLTPILADVAGVGETAVSPLLMAVGLCCMCSNLLAGWVGAHGGIRLTPLVLLGQTVLFAAMPALLGGRLTGLAALLAMCLLMYALSTPVQLHALELSEREHPYAAGLCATTLSVAGNIGIAAGSFASSALQEPVGLRALGLPAAVFALAGLGLNLALLRVCGFGRRVPRVSDHQKS